MKKNIGSLFAILCSMSGGTLYKFLARLPFFTLVLVRSEERQVGESGESIKNALLSTNNRGKLSAFFIQLTREVRKT